MSRIVRKVIAGKNQMPKLPLHTTGLIILMLDFWKAPAWLWGVLLTLLAILWICVIGLHIRYDYQERDIFKAEDK